MDMELLFRDEDHSVDALLFGLADEEDLDLGMDFAMDRAAPAASSPSASSSSPASSYSSPSAGSDDMSSGDWLTDAGSEVASPAPQRFASPMKSPVSPVPLAAMTLPYALPVAFFPPQSMTQKRTFPEMAAATTTVLPSAVPAPNGAKRSKREIRQMKNRESANKSRLRRKAQLGELTTEVQELAKAKHELETTIAGLRAENKSLREQNSFLRSLVTGDQTARQAALLQQQQQPMTSISVLESPQQTDAEEQEDEEEEVTASPKKTRRATQTSRVLAAVACASVFGITLFSDYEVASGSQHHIRRSGRVLHGLPSPSDNGLTPVTDPNGPLMSMVFMLWAVLVSLWTECISTKWTRDMLVGFVVNVVSYEIIASVHHLWWEPYQRSKSSKKKKLLPTARSNAKPHRSSSSSSTNQADAAGSRRTASWDALRFRDPSRSAVFDHGSSLPRVHVFT